jgi:hypothetical protein
MSYWNKQASSRWLRSNNIAYAGGQASLPSTTFSAQTYQLRLTTQVAGYFKVGDAGTSATANTDSFIAANVAPEYVTVGQVIAFVSTTTSTGQFSCTEMA